jgi:hypothetical protein
MANIFKSKEVYKHVTTEPHNGGQHKLIPVRGVYVANVYRPPYYIDHTLEITNIENSYVTVDEYKETPVTAFASGIFTDVNIAVTNNPPYLKYYAQTPVTVCVDIGMILDVTIVNNNPYLLYYSKIQPTYAMEPFEGTVSVVNNSCFIEIYNIINEHEIDDALQIISIDSNDATIT